MFRVDVVHVKDELDGLCGLSILMKNPDKNQCCTDTDDDDGP